MDGGTVVQTDINTCEITNWNERTKTLQSILDCSATEEEVEEEVILLYLQFII
jgi:hypothetical protein